LPANYYTNNCEKNMYDWITCTVIGLLKTCAKLRRAARHNLRNSISPHNMFILINDVTGMPGFEEHMHFL